MAVTTAIAIISISTVHAEWSSFHGAPNPSSVLERMMSKVNRWTPADKELFVRRAIEGALWAEPRHSNVAFASDEGMKWLGSVFPELSGKDGDEGTVINVGQILGRTHPQIRKSVGVALEPKARFHTYPSPTALFEYDYNSPEDRFASREWKKVLNLIEEGATWEKKHPEIDYALDPDHGFVLRVRQMLPSLKVSASVLGVRVQDLYQSVLVALGKRRK